MATPSPDLASPGPLYDGQVARAILFAGMAHHTQKRKGLDEPYIGHCVRVALEAYRYGLCGEAVAAAALHDVVEDTVYGLNDLREAGFNERILTLVELLTKTYGDNASPEIKAVEKPKYYARILTDVEAVRLKLLDRTDNLRDMKRMVKRNPDERLVKWAVRYCKKTEDEFGPLLARVDNSASPDAHIVWEFSQALHHAQHAATGALVSAKP